MDDGLVVLTVKDSTKSIPDLIRENLRKNPKGMTITEIASIIDINRNSTARYLDVLQISGQVEMRKVGSAKMYFLSQRIPLEAMLGLSEDGILTYDAEMNIIRANESFAKLLEINRDDLLGSNMGQMKIPGFDTDEILKWIKQAATGGYKTLETRISLPAHSLFIRAKMVPTTFEDGSVGGTIILEDMTERKQQEEELQRQRDFLHLVMDSVAHPFYVIDAEDYTIKMANKAARLGSLRPDSTCYSLTHRSSQPCSGDVHPCPLREVRNTRKPAITNHIHHHVSGRTRHVEIHAHPILDSDGNVVQVIEYNLDVTERRQIEYDLRRLLNMYQLLVEQMDECMLVVQEESIVFCNAPSARLLGYEVHELTGASIRQIATADPIPKATDENSGYEWQPYMMRSKNGKLIEVIAKTAVSEYMGSLVHILSVRVSSRHNRNGVFS